MRLAVNIFQPKNLSKLHIKFFGGKYFTAKRVVFSGKDFLAPSLPENFHLCNEKFWNVGRTHQACRRVILVPSRQQKFATHKTKPTNYNIVQVIYYHPVGCDNCSLLQSTWYIKCGCNSHTNAIRTGLHITLIQWCTTTCFNLWQYTRRIFPIQFESHKHLINIWIM